MKRKFKFNFKPIVFLLVGILLGSMIPMGSLWADANNIKLIINDKEIQCEVPPTIINGRTMVMARDIVENMGGQVSWDNDNRTIVIVGGVENGGVPSDLSSGTVTQPTTPISQPITNTDKVSNTKEEKYTVQQNGIWYAKGRWIIEQIELKNPGKVLQLGIDGNLKLTDKTNIQLDLITINNNIYYSLSKIIDQGLISESDIN